MGLGVDCDAVLTSFRLNASGLTYEGDDLPMSYDRSQIQGLHHLVSEKVFRLSCSLGKHNLSSGKRVIDSVIDQFEVVHALLDVVAGKEIVSVPYIYGDGKWRGMAYMFWGEIKAGFIRWGDLNIVERLYRCDSDLSDKDESDLDAKESGKDDEEE